MADLSLPVQRLPHGEGLDLPRYETEGAAGMDLMAAISQPLSLAPFERAAIPTGLAVAIPRGYEAQIRPRSGLAFRYGLTIVNAPGTIDSDYRGEIKVLLINLGNETVVIERGMRIAQMVLAPCLQASLDLVDLLDETGRGEGGFGSTGQ
ncbi:dUTP diphosphatase [Alphaproteobacteria bacterium LSUCC0684]